MRLIDADKIYIELPARLTMPDMKRELWLLRQSVKRAFENAETVEVIPIAWLKQMAEKIPSATIEIETPNNLAVFKSSEQFVDVLTELWRKHNNETD